MYSFIVTFSFLPDGLVPTLKRDSLNLSKSLFARTSERIILLPIKCATYIELPFLHTAPVFGNTCDDAWTATLFVPFNEFFNSKVVDVDPLNSVSKRVRVVNLENFVLSTPVAVLAPVTQKKATLMH